MALFIQLEQSPQFVAGGDDYRIGFRDLALRMASPDENRFLVLEADPRRVSEVRNLWERTPQVEVVNGVAASYDDHESTVEFYATRSPMTGEPILMDSVDGALTIDPLTEPRRTPIPRVRLSSLLDELVEEFSRVGMLSIDLETAPAKMLFEQFDDIPRPATVVLTLPARGSENWNLTRTFERFLHERGYVQCGRAWGAAGSNIQFMHAPGLKSRFRCWLKRLQRDLGSIVVSLRERLRSARLSTPVAVLAQASRVLGRHLSAPLDYSNGQALVSISPHAALQVSSVVRSSTGSVWELDADELSRLLEDFDPTGEALACHAALGVWPISFSYPALVTDEPRRREKLLSHIVPGFPYAFTKHDQYVEEYRSSMMALTFRKAGWDCFRHVEILGSGAIPVMPDVAAVPRFSMVHYPKEALLRVHERIRSEDGHPGPETRRAFAACANRWLTTGAMARYILDMPGLGSSTSALFIDTELDHQSDYMSLLTLIGLKQNLGSECFTLKDVDYLYEDTTVDTNTLYGRGFGYSKVLPATARSGDAFSLNSAPAWLKANEPAVLIVGSIARNMELAQTLLHYFPAERTIWIHGEDYPPSRREAQILRQSGTHLFVRSIEPIGSPRRRGYLGDTPLQIW